MSLCKPLRVNAKGLYNMKSFAFDFFTILSIMLNSMSEVFLRFLTSYLSIIVVCIIYGTNLEHGDSNAGSMYGVIALVPAFFITAVSLLLYFIFDCYVTTKLNQLKSGMHLILMLSLFGISPAKPLYLLIIISTVTILIVNLLFIFYNRLKS
jgi:hypothetical protein